jgi:O-antigen/teichoic acid export membrane protein
VRTRDIRRRIGALGSADHSIRAGAATVLGAQSLVYLLGLATSIVIARTLGAEGRGSYLLPVTAATIAVSFGQLGVEHANTYLVAERGYSLQRLSSVSAALVLIIGPIAVVAALGFYLVAQDGLLAGVGWVEMLIAAAAIPFGIHNIWLANLCLLGKRLPQTQLAAVMGAAIQTVGAVALAIAGLLTVRGVLVLWLIATIVPWLMHMNAVTGFAPPRPALRREAIAPVLRTGLQFYGVLLFTFLLLRTDLFLVNRYLDVDAVGVYSLAVLLAEMIWLVIQPLVTAVLAYQVDAERQEAGRLSFKAARFNLAIAVLGAAFFAAVGWFAIPAVYGADFTGAYTALMVLLPGIVAAAAARPLGNWLLRQGRPLALSSVCLMAFCLNVVLNLILIPEIGILGASLASSIAYFVLAGCQVVWAMRASRLRVSQAWLPQPGDGTSFRRLVRR